MFSRLTPLFLRSFRHKRRAWLLASSLSLVVGTVTLTAQTASPGRVKMAGSFRAVSPAGQSTVAAPAENVRDTLTAAEAGAPMRIRLMLRIRNSGELQRRVMAGEIISREEMAARFLPDARDHQAVADWLVSQGLTVTPAGAAHAVVMASGTPVQLEKAFETHFARVRYRGEEHTSATVAPTVPAEIRARISSVHGLQPHLHAHKFSTPLVDISTYALLYGEFPHYVNEITHAYNVTATGLTGAGQTIGIIIDTPPLTGDLTAFYKNNALVQTIDNYSLVDVDNVGVFDLPTGEETLDTEWSSGIAVGAKLVVYATNTLDNVNDAYSRVLDDLQKNAEPGLHQISMSYGAGEMDGETVDDIDSVHDLFAGISAYGVSLFASSGDSGAFGNSKRDDIVEVNYPASDPLVTGVGGTSLYLSDALTVEAQSLEAEYGWSFDTGNGSSGGGYSVIFALPSYQTGVELRDGNGMRQVPDVSLVADPGTAAYLVFDDKPTAVGGTSWSSPCWAGMCALLNQARAEHGRASLTALNSLLYPLQTSTAAFRDILGDKTNSDNGVYDTTTGYDLVTGLGVPNFTVLSQHLATVQQTTFFDGQVALANGVYYLAFPNGDYFGYYSYLNNTNYIYHQDLGYEYVFNADDGDAGVYLYDFKSGDFFYTSPTYPFPYLYDFTLNSTLYYYPSTTNPGHYNTDGIRYFYDFSTGKTIER